MRTNLAIISPKAGDIWYFGDIHYIKWATNNEDDEVLNIEIQMDGAAHPIVDNVPMNACKYVWRVDVPAWDGYIIKLSSPSSPSVFSGSFEIREYPKNPFSKLLTKIFNLFKY